jgi:hypothetical protein
VHSGVSVVAGAVKEGRLVRATVGAQCLGREMDAKEEQHVTCKADNSASKTVELIQKAYVDAAVSRTTIFEWHHVDCVF